MLNKVVQDQLAKVEVADLSNYDKETSTYSIPKRVDIKLEEDCCYLIHLKPSAYNNQTVIVNWNNGSKPNHDYLKIDISKKMGKMIKVVSVAYDYYNKVDLSDFWAGWLLIDDLDIISKL